MINHTNCPDPLSPTWGKTMKIKVTTSSRELNRILIKPGKGWNNPVFCAPRDPGHLHGRHGVVIIGRSRYSIGVNPRVGKSLDLRALTSLLNLDESRWEGRQNVIGSPRQCGSAMPADKLQEIIAWIKS